MNDTLRNPKPGDSVAAFIGDELVTRTVLEVKSGMVTYIDNFHVFDKKCYLATWRAWCRKNNAEEVSE